MEQYTVEQRILYLARQSLKEGRYEYTLECCKMVLKDNPKSSAAYFYRGCAKFYLGQLNAAACAFSRAARYSEGSSCVAINSAVVHANMGKADGLFRLVDIPNKALYAENAYELAGITLAQRGQYELAEANFEGAHKCIPNYARACANHGTALLQKYLEKPEDEDLLERAIGLFNIAIVNSAFNKYAYYNRCRAYIIKKQYTLALRDARKLLVHDKEDPGFHYIHAKILYLCERYDEAVDSALTAYWYGTKYNAYVADEAIKLCETIAEAQV